MMFSSQTKTILKGLRDWHHWLTRGFHDGADMKLDGERRIGDRLPVSSLARLAVSNTNYLVEIEDISKGGCALRLRQGLVPAPHRDVEIVFPGEARRVCTVRWTTETSIGLEFEQPIAEFMDLVQLEHLGENYFRALIRLQSKC